MSDLDDLAATIAAGLTAVGVAKQAVIEAAHLATEARDLLGQVLAGTNDPEAAMMPAQLDNVRADCEGFAAALGSTTATLQGYLASLGRSIAPEASQVNAPKRQDEPHGRFGARDASPSPALISQERLDELRAELPPPVASGRGEDRRRHAPCHGLDQQHAL